MIKAYQPTQEMIQEHGLIAVERNGQVFWIIEPPAMLADVSNLGQAMEWLMATLPMPESLWLSWAQGDPVATLVVGAILALLTAAVIAVMARSLMSAIKGRRKIPLRKSEGFVVKKSAPQKRGATPKRQKWNVSLLTRFKR